MLRHVLGAALITALFASPLAAAELDGRVIRIGSDTTYPPLETVDEATGQIVGFDVDILDAICERINCVPEFVTTAWDGIFAAPKMCLSIMNLPFSL